MATKNDKDIVVKDWPFEAHFCPRGDWLVLVSKMDHSKDRGNCSIPQNVFKKMLREAYGIFHASIRSAERKRTAGTQISLSFG